MLWMSVYAALRLCVAVDNSEEKHKLEMWRLELEKQHSIQHKEQQVSHNISPGRCLPEAAMVFVRVRNCAIKRGSCRTCERTCSTKTVTAQLNTRRWSTRSSPR